MHPANTHNTHTPDPVRGGQTTQPEARPPLCEKGHALVLTASYYLASSGSASVMRNLLARFDPDSYTIVTYDQPESRATVLEPDARVFRIPSTVPVLRRGAPLWRRLYHPIAQVQIARLAARLKPSVVVGVYPHLEFFQFALHTAKTHRIPLVAYLHDTLAETWSSTPRAAEAQAAQDALFREASVILTISEGMGRLLAEQHKVPSVTVPHMFPEAIDRSAETDVNSREAFMGGSVYGVNARSLRRLHVALEKQDCILTLATQWSEDELRRWGITGPGLRTTYYADRSAYLKAVRQKGILVLPLDWPDETDIHEHELATAFPTKTLEYLSSGRPIIVHCPEHYFLAQFIRENRCGILVSERDENGLAEAIQAALAGGPEMDAMTQAAWVTLSRFTVQNVVQAFQSSVNDAAGCAWGEKVRRA